MIDLEKPLEGVDYTIEPLEGLDNEQAWKVVVRKGLYKDKTLIYNQIQYNGKTQRIKYQLHVINESNELEQMTPEIDDYAFNILVDIIKTGITNGSVVLDDKDSDNGSVAGE